MSAMREAASVGLMLKQTTGVRFERTRPPARFRVRGKEIRWFMGTVNKTESNLTPHANLTWADRYGCLNIESALIEDMPVPTKSAYQKLGRIGRSERIAHESSVRYGVPVRIIREVRERNAQFRLGAKVQIGASSKQTLREVRLAVKALSETWSRTVSSNRQDGQALWILK